MRPLPHSCFARQRLIIGPNAPQAIIDIAEDFLARMCGAAKLLAEHRSVAESAQAAAAAAGSAANPPPARGAIEVKDFKLYLSRHAGMEVTDFDEQRWVDTLQTKLSDEKRAREEAAAREAAARAAQAAAVAKRADDERAAVAAKMAADAAAAQAQAVAQQQANANANANGQTAAPGQDQIFNAERQRQMEAAACVAVAQEAEASFPTRFIITCINCQTLMQAPKVPPTHTPRIPVLISSLS